MNKEDMQLFILPNRFTILTWSFFAGLVAMLTYPLIWKFREYYVANTPITTRDDVVQVGVICASIAFFAVAFVVYVAITIFTHYKTKRIEKMGHMVIKDEDSPFS